jgi:hypothetical protein
VRQHLESQGGFYSAAFGEQYPFAESEHLYGEADVDGQLEQGLVVAADEGHGAAEPAQNGLDPLECVGLAADDDRQGS